MAPQNPPAKHHYVPKTYQKGFSLDRTKVFVYRKKFGTLKEQHPTEVIYQTELHTIQFGDKKTTMIESWFSQMENAFAEYTKLLHNLANDNQSFSEVKSSPEFLKILKIMVACQYWRLPSRRGEAKQVAARLLEFYDQASAEVKELLGFDRKGVRTLKKTASSTGAMKFIQFFMLPLLTFDIIRIPADWLLRFADSGTYYLSSDNPVICENYEKLFIFEDVIFPISKDLLLISFSQAAKISMAEINQKIFDAASEFVISPTRDLILETKNAITSPADISILSRQEAIPRV